MMAINQKTKYTKNEIYSCKSDLNPWSISLLFKWKYSIVLHIYLISELVEQTIWNFPACMGPSI